MKRQNMFDVANPVGSDWIEIETGLQSLVSTRMVNFQAELSSKVMDSFQVSSESSQTELDFAPL